MKFPQNPKLFAQNGQNIWTARRRYYLSEKISRDRYEVEKILTESQKFKEFEFDILETLWTSVLEKAPLVSQNIVFFEQELGILLIFS